MKKAIKMLCIVFILLVFTVPANAESVTDGYIEDFRDILPDELSGIIDNPESLSSTVGLRSLLEEIFAAASGQSGPLLSFFLMLLGLVALMAAATFLPDRLSGAAQTGVGIISAVIIFERVGGIFVGVGESLSELCDFFAVLAPVMTGITVAGGGGGTASVQSSAMALTIALVGRVGTSLFYAVAGFGFALALLSPLGDNGVGSVARWVKSFFTWLLGIATTLIMATLSLQTAVSSAADSAAMRAARYAASGMIPVVGSTVSGALSTLASGLSYAKGIVGAGAVWVIVTIFLSPLVMLLLYRLALSLCAMLASAVGVESAVRIFEAFRSSFDSIIAVYSLCAVLYIFETVLFMKSGVALL